MWWFHARSRNTLGWLTPLPADLDLLESNAAAIRFSMTANAVIDEIKHLQRAEQSRVIHFALELARERQMSGDQLSELARQMADSANPAEVQRLREEIHRGFYGE